MKAFALSAMMAVVSLSALAQTAPNADARHLTSLVAGAIAQRDYGRAESLAVTTEHWNMIAKAKQQDIDNARMEKEATSRNRPLKTTCYPNEYGYANSICITR